MAKFRQNHQRKGRGTTGLFRLFLLLLLLFGALIVFLLNQPQWFEPAEPLLFLPEGGDLRVERIGEAAAAGREADGRTVWVAWQQMAGAGKLPPAAARPFISERTTGRIQIMSRRLQEVFWVTGLLEKDSTVAFLVMLDLRQPGYAGSACLGPAPLELPTDTSRWVPIDSIEALTGLNFFPNFMLPELEDSLESQTDPDHWILPGRSPLAE